MVEDGVHPRRAHHRQMQVLVVDSMPVEAGRVEVEAEVGEVLLVAEVARQAF